MKLSTACKQYVENREIKYKKAKDKKMNKIEGRN